MTPDLNRLWANLEPHIRAVGAFIRVESRRFSPDAVETKGRNDLVSYVDRTAEQRLTAACQQLLPAAGFIREEAGSQNPDREWVWVIDPLDGTTNFVHNLPVFSISLALLHHGQPVLGAVHEINRDEMFHALKGQGARLNGQSFSTSARQSLRNSLVATGFPYQQFGGLEAYVRLLRDMMLSTRGVRRLGSAAVDLAYVACGRFDAFFESNLKPWDVAAGALLVREAGGRVTDYLGGDAWLFGPSIVATNGAVHTEMLEMLARHAPAQWARKE